MRLPPPLDHPPRSRRRTPRRRLLDRLGRRRGGRPTRRSPTKDLATKALAILGAKVDGAQQQCNRCHDINKATLTKWAADYKKTSPFLGDESKSIDERINYMRRDPGRPDVRRSRPRSSASSPRARTSAAAPRSTSTRTPATYKQAQILDEALRRRKDDEYAKFRDDTLMPIEPSYDRLSAGEYEAIATWLDKGMPKLDELLIGGGTPHDVHRRLHAA